MNARLVARLTRPAVSQTKPKPCGVTIKAMRLVIAQWHAAGCQHLLAGTTPADQLPTDADNETVRQLQATARLCGC